MSKFVLRKDEDTENPILARFYGDGITNGRVILYSKIGTRTAFLCLIAQGARFQGDTGCAKVRRVVYAGFDIPEFDATGARNWRFHKGYQSKHPVYRRVTMSQAGSTINDAGTTLVDGQKVAFHKRGASQTIPAEIIEDTAYFVVNKTTNSYQISLTSGGAAIAFSSSSSGTEIFAYRADDAGLFDVDQGRPEFFPGLDFTFSGKAYIEILLPAELSNGEDEPTRTQLICRGKEVYDFVVAGDSYLDTTGSPLDLEDPALIAYDILKNDLLAPRDRFNGASWVAWRDRNAGMIPWAGGNENPATPGSFSVLTGFTYTQSTGTLKSNLPDSSYARAVTNGFTDRHASVDGVYGGGLFRLAFTSDAAGNTTYHGIYVGTDGFSLFYTNGSTNTKIADVYPSDRIKIAFEVGVFIVYRNGIQIPMTGLALAPQIAGNSYIKIEIGTLNAQFSDIRIVPSGSLLNPRQVRRFYGDLVSPNILPVATAFEALIAICPGVVWQDVDGEITILPDPDREPVFTFFHDLATDTPSNTSRVSVYNREDPPNYWRFSYRNKDDVILTKAYANADRPELRAENGGKKHESGGIQTYGVLTPSQMDRIGETIARVVADLNFGFDIDGFLDSLTVAKGDYVNVIDPTGGFVEGDPSLQIVLHESFDLPNDDIETRGFKTQVILPNWYSDTEHGKIVPVTRTTASARFSPAPYLLELELIEYARLLPDQTYIPVIQGNATFDPSMFGQTGRVFIKQNVGVGNEFTYVNSTTFDLVDPSVFRLEENDAVSMMAVDPGTGELPGGILFEDKLFLKNLNLETGTFQVSKTPGGAAVSVTSGGVGELRLFPYADWQDTGLRLTPNPDTMEAGFEIDSIPIGYHYVRVVTVSPGGIYYPFELHPFEWIYISGEIIDLFPPPIVDDLTLTEAIAEMPDGSFVSSIVGAIDFAGYPEGTQYAKLFTKTLREKISDVTLVSGTDTFTVATPGTVPAGSTPIALISSSGSNPGNFQVDQPYYPVNISGDTFKLSLEIGGAAVDFSSNGSNLAIYPDAAWVDTGVTAEDDNGSGVFEIVPVRKAIVLVRAQTLTRRGLTSDFSIHYWESINITETTAPPVLTALTLSERQEYKEDGTSTSWIDGIAGFGLYLYKQYGQIFTKVLSSKIGDITLNAGTDVFTMLDDGVIPSGSTPVLLAAEDYANHPGNYQIEVPYYVVNVSGNTFGLSLSIGGAAVNFSSNGSDLGLYHYADWQDTGQSLLKRGRPAGDVYFTLGPIPASVTWVRVVTLSVDGDITADIATQLQRSIQIADGAPSPPPIIASLILSENNFPLPDGTIATSINGKVTFGTYGYEQYGRVYTKTLVNKIGDVTLNSATDVFTLLGGTMPSGVTPISLASTSSSGLPGNAQTEEPYYVVNVSGNTFKLSLSIGGAAVDFSSNGSGLAIYPDQPFIDTGMLIKPRPGASNLGRFEITPALRSLTLVRVQTYSANDTTLDAASHLMVPITVIGDQTPPSIATSLTLTERNEEDPNEGFVTSVLATIQFAAFGSAQYGKIWTKTASTDWVEHGGLILPDASTNQAVYEIKKVPKGLLEVRVVTHRRDSDVWLAPFINHRYNTITVIGSSTTPPIATSLTLTERNEEDPNEGFVTSVLAVVQFATSSVPQYGQLWTKTATTDWVQTGRRLLPDPSTNQASVEIRDVPKGLFEARIVTHRRSGDLSITPFSSHRYNSITVGGSASVPPIATALTLTERNELDPNSGLMTSVVANVTFDTYAYPQYGQLWIKTPTTDWMQTGRRLLPDPSTNQASAEISGVQKGLLEVRVVTHRRSGDNSIAPFTAHRSQTLNVVGSSATPSHPASAWFEFNGISLTLKWEPSTSPNVNTYLIKDENNNTIAQVSGTALAYTEASVLDLAIRRVYAVSYKETISASYAEARWVRGPLIKFQNPTGGTISEDQVLTKTAGLGWNCGASLDYLVLTNAAYASLAFTVDRTDHQKAFGLTLNPFPISYTDMDIGVWLAAGSLYAVYKISGSSFQTYLGVYSAGDRYIIESTPSGSGTSTYTLSRITTTLAGLVTKTVVHTYSGSIAHAYPIYAGVALYNTGSVFSPSLEISGLLTAPPFIPGFKSGLSTDSSYDTSGNLSVIDPVGGPGGNFGWAVDIDNPIEPAEDGILQFRHNSGAGIAGLSDSTSVANYAAAYTSIRLGVEFDGFGNASWYDNGSSGAISGGTNSSIVWTIGRENLKMVLRRNGVLIRTSTVSTTYQNSNLYTKFVVGSDNSMGLLALRRAYPATAPVDPSTGNRLPVKTSVANPKIGLNRLGAIPKFTGAVAGQALVYDAAGQIKTEPFPTVTTPTFASLGVTGSPDATNFVRGDMVWANPLTAGKPVINGGANRVLHQDGSSNLAASAGLTFANNRLVSDAMIHATPNATSMFIASAISGSYSGSNNTVFGYGAGASLTSGSQNTFIGREAGRLCTTQSDCVGIGFAALYSLTNTGSHNLAVGSSALQNLATGSFNVAMGTNALQLCTNSGNIGIGYRAGVAVVGGSYNTLIGSNAGTGITSGTNNVVIGADAAGSLISGSNCVIIGQNVNVWSSSASSQTNINNTWYGDGTNAYVQAKPFQVRYDASNYLNVSTASNGVITFDSVGSVPRIIFADPVSVRRTIIDKNTTGALNLTPSDSGKEIHVSHISASVSVSTAHQSYGGVAQETVFYIFNRHTTANIAIQGADYFIGRTESGAYVASDEGLNLAPGGFVEIRLLATTNYWRISGSGIQTI